jgi:hypothetical protein
MLCLRVMEENDMRIKRWNTISAVPMLFNPVTSVSAVSNRKCGLAGCNYKYPHRPKQGEQEKARRRRQVARGMLNAENRNL